jgi:hypothetical protein
MEYIRGLDKNGDSDNACFICRDLENPQDDDKNLAGIC